MRRLALAAIAVLLAAPAWADMYQDARNATLPEAWNNLSMTPSSCDGKAGSDGAVTGTAMTSASAVFAASDVGKKVTVRKAATTFYASQLAVAAGGAGHGVGDLVNFPNGISAFVLTATAGAVTKVYVVSGGSGATGAVSPIAQTTSIKAGSTPGAPIAGGTGLTLTPTWTRENLVTTIAAVGSATSATLAAPAGAALTSAVWGYGTDYGPEIQAALDANRPVGLPQGICGIGQTLALTSGDALLGKGSGGGAAASTLMYLGPANQPQVSVGSTTGPRILGVQFGNLMLDGMGAASKGLYLRGAASGLYWDTAMRGHTTVGLDVHGSESGCGGGAGCDAIKNWFQRLDIAENENPYLDADATAHGIWWGFPNTTESADHDLSHYAAIQTKIAATSPGLVCGVSDHNTVVYIQTRAGGPTQPAIEMLGGNWAVTGSCRNHHIVGMDAGEGGLAVRSTGWAQKPENIVDFYDRGNGGADHNVEADASLTIRDSTGGWDGLELRGRNYVGFAQVPLSAAGTLHYVMNTNTRTPGAIPSGVGTYAVPVVFDGTNWRVSAALRPRAILNTNWANPAGTTSTTHVMQGLGAAAALTPAVSGNVMVTLNGHVANSAAAGTTRVRLQYGTGTAPVNGVAITGNTACTNSPQVTWTSPTAAAALPFSLTCIVTGLTLDTPAWFDAAIAGSAANTSTISGVTIQAAEQ